jgi:hypothetical protein
MSDLSPSYPALTAVAVFAILAVVADMFDRDHVLVLGGIEHDDALGRAADDHAARQCPL